MLTRRVEKETALRNFECPKINIQQHPKNWNSRLYFGSVILKKNGPKKKKVKECRKCYKNENSLL